MTKERVLESQDIRTVFEGAAQRKAVDPYDWSWAFFVCVVYAALGMAMAGLFWVGL